MLALVLLALALAADAFAVSLVRGASGRRGLGAAIECGAAFGLAQGVMPLIGWSAGALMADWFAALDHWIAFGLLGFLGVRMIREGLARGKEEAQPLARGSHLFTLAAAALATSVDAAAAGLTLELFAAPVWLSCLVIGLVTAALCSLGYGCAARVGPRLGSGAEIAGGVVLIGLGVRILVEHMG